LVLLALYSIRKDPQALVTATDDTV